MLASRHAVLGVVGLSVLVEPEHDLADQQGSARSRLGESHRLVRLGEIGDEPSVGFVRLGRAVSAEVDGLAVVPDLGLSARLVK